MKPKFEKVDRLKVKGQGRAGEVRGIRPDRDHGWEYLVALDGLPATSAQWIREADLELIHFSAEDIEASSKPTGSVACLVALAVYTILVAVTGFLLIKYVLTLL